MFYIKLIITLITALYRAVRDGSYDEKGRILPESRILIPDLSGTGIAVHEVPLMYEGDVLIPPHLPYALIRHNRAIGQVVIVVTPGFSRLSPGAKKGGNAA